ncbi:MAG: hypothetical protein ACKOXB_11330 [Flavobacteriales bacterium]
MKNLFLIITGFASLLIIGWSCKKETMGPDITGLYGPVTIVEAFDASKTTVDFSKDEEVHFTAKFEKETNWLVTITGATSGATKTFEGISSTVDISNAKWIGTANDAPSFQKENVTATLSFKNTTGSHSKTIAVTGQKNLDKNGVLVSDFSNISKTLSWGTDWPKFTLTNTSYTQADGNKYIYITGTPWQKAPGSNSITPYVNFVEVKAKDAATNYGTYYPLAADSNKVYFNIMVYGTGQSDTWFLVNFAEDGVTSRHLNIRPDWTGWKLISVPYASLLDDVSTPGKPDKLTAVTFVLLSDATPPESKAVSVAFDHVIFTTNKPYQP